MVTTCQHPQDRRVILQHDAPQVRMPQRDDRRGASIVRVGLVLAARVQQPCPRRQRRRHVEHDLARSDELLREQRADAGRALDRPRPRHERCRPLDERLALRPARGDAQFADHGLVAIDHCRGVRRLVRIDPNDEHEALLIAFGAPWRAFLIRVPFLFRATPQLGNRRDGRFAKKPTNTAAGHSRDHPPEPSTLRTNRNDVHPILHQGNMSGSMAPSKISAARINLLVVVRLCICDGG